MPALLFDRRGLRRAAWTTLVVWLFALTAGVVNACVLTPAGPAQRSVGQVWHAGISTRDPDAGAPTGVRDGSRHGHGESVALRGHGQDAGKLGCLKFCVDETTAIAKVKLPMVDLASSLLTVVEPWNPIAAAGRVGLRPSLEQPGSRGPPLVIRFLRLTL